jgi:hypothetical protein
LIQQGKHVLSLLFFLFAKTAEMSALSAIREGAQFLRVALPSKNRFSGFVLGFCRQQGDDRSI